MQKLKNSILARMIEKKLTSKEIDFLLYISRFQDNNGRVDGVYYKEICQRMHMSNQGFYDVKRSLTEKGLISTEKSSRIDHDITILDNAFLSQEDIEKGYVNTNHHIFYQERFYKLKAGAKLLAMEFMKRSYAGKGKCRIGVRLFYEKFMELFGVGRRAMRGYLTALKPFFSIGRKNGIYYIRPKVEVYHQSGQPSENDNYAAHKVEVFCRRSGIREAGEKEVKDTGILIRQYRKAALAAGKDVIQVVGRAIERCAETVLTASGRGIRKLKPKLVHMYVKEELGLC